jgi:MIF4G domain
MKRPEDLPEFLIVKGPSRGGGGGDRRQVRPEGGGGGSSWQRGAAPPRRSSIEKPISGGGGQWARGQAPPPKTQGRGGGGGGGRGGRGDRGSMNGPPFFDGPVAPLVKSTNGWRPVKSSSALGVAEKLVKAVLNKMTKEKFDRLSAQMCEIPVLSYEILTMMIGNVYEKAIDEPTFGDMYGDLCVKLSQQVQTDSFVKIVESDEEPPTEDGESSPEASSEQSSRNSVYRWSNDVGTTDAEIVGPFQSVEECFEVALSDTEQERIDRNDMELEIVKLQIQGGMFIKVFRKKLGSADAEPEEGEQPEYYTVYFPVANHEECGQQLSKIFLSERECALDASKQNSFKRSLLNKCEDEFSKQDIYVDWKKEKAAYEATKSTLSEAERAEKEEELHFRRIKIKKQMLGNVKFIGQLYKKNLLKEKIMRFCIASLLKLEADDIDAKVRTYHDAGDEDMDEEDHEAICSMFTTIGSTIDGPPAADFLTVCFKKIKRLSTSSDLPSRSRFMYKDLLELRQSKWVPRRTVEDAKTIEEIRKDFEREERMKEKESQQMNAGYRGGGKNDYGRNDNRRGSDFRGNARPSQPSVGSSRRQASKPAVVTDDDGFTTIKSGKSSLAQAVTNRENQRQAPKVITKQAYAALTDDTPTPSHSEPAPEVLSVEKLERRVGTIRGEFFQDPSDIENLLLSMDELSGTPNYGVIFVQKNCDFIVDCRDSERESVYALHSLLVAKGRLSSDDVKAGMSEFVEFIDSYACDAPRAFEYLGEFLGNMIKAKAVDVAWICEQAEKTTLSLADNPEKIIVSLIKAMKKVIGDDETRSVMESSSVVVEKLLGAAKWATIKSDL